MADPIELAAIERGAGDPVALVHGGVFHSGPAWAQSIGALAGAGYRVIAVDRRGHGHSDAGDADFIPVHLHADDLRLTLELRDAKNVHLVGVSYGALVCLEFALSWPDRVSSMTLVEPALFAWVADDPDMGVWLERFDEIAASAAAGAPMTEWVPRWLMLIDSKMAKEITPDSPSWSLIRKQGPLIFKEEPGWRYRPDRGLIRNLFVPTLVLNGDQSEPPVQMIGEMLAEDLPLGTHEW
ncbi:MAG TPA: alpha/beta fold hydrolase, partial [Actinomycetota bacterium]|nr:alpha/beta fold hydrolase [Actinomycetota bacterium]